jgi:hypothetical protein
MGIGVLNALGKAGLPDTNSLLLKHFLFFSI